MKENAEQELRNLKYKLSGYKASNQNFRKQVAELRKLVDKYKTLSIEGDELYEATLAKLDSRNELIVSLQDRCRELSIACKEKDKEIESLKVALDVETNKPWWKRIF